MTLAKVATDSYFSPIAESRMIVEIPGVQLLGTTFRPVPPTQANANLIRMEWRERRIGRAKYEGGSGDSFSLQSEAQRQRKYDTYHDERTKRDDKDK
jgi:hypothetical protein